MPSLRSSVRYDPHTCNLRHSVVVHTGHGKRTVYTRTLQYSVVDVRSIACQDSIVSRFHGVKISSTKRVQCTQTLSTADSTIAKCKQ